MFKLKASKRLKKFLKLWRQIATINGHKGFAFDALKISQSLYDEYKPPTLGLQKSRILVSYFNYSTDLLNKFVVLVDTDQGVYLLENAVKVVLDLTPSRERIKIKISAKVLQKVKVYGFKILDPSKLCIAVSGQLPTLSLYPDTDTFEINYDVLAFDEE